MSRWVDGKAHAGVILCAALLGAFTAWTLAPVMLDEIAPVELGADRGHGLDQGPRLVGYQPYPEWAEQCSWTPASSAVLSRPAGASPLPAGVIAKPAQLEVPPERRDPLRVLRDSFPGYTAVGVDVSRDEVILTDENLFQILVYDRLTDTPAISRSDPKRIIGGLSTKIEFQCGLYIDPNNGDIYAANNDTMRTLVVFSREAEGNVPPLRELRTPLGTFGIAVDEAHQELILSVQHDNAVVVYRKEASGDEAPIRWLQGDRTRLADPHGIALDTKNDVLFVANFGSVRRVRESNSGADSGRNGPLGRNAIVAGSGQFRPPSITVYPRSASGDTPPLRVITGPKAQLNWPTGLAVDPERQELYVANDMGNSVLVFSAAASGDVGPIRILKGENTNLKNPTGLTLDFENDELWVTNFGNHTATVYPRTASGDVPPLRTIRSAPAGIPSLMIGNPGAVEFDTRRAEILVPN